MKTFNDTCKEYEEIYKSNKTFDSLIINLMLITELKKINENLEEIKINGK